MRETLKYTHFSDVVFLVAIGTKTGAEEIILE
jgi:hypothetical protein